MKKKVLMGHTWSKPIYKHVTVHVYEAKGKCHLKEGCSRPLYGSAPEPGLFVFHLNQI